MACGGEPSVQNALDMAMRSLKMLPTHASREILVILGSLTTCDPGDINVTIQVSLRQNNY
jgi:transcription initiation factor TFIIH subunit 2